MTQLNVLNLLMAKVKVETRDTHSKCQKSNIIYPCNTLSVIVINKKAEGLMYRQLSAR